MYVYSIHIFINIYNTHNKHTQKETYNKYYLKQNTKKTKYF